MNFKKITAIAVASIMSLTGIVQSVPSKSFAAGSMQSTNVFTESAISSNDMTIKTSNSFGNLVASELSAKQEEQLQNNGYNIFSVEMNGNEASVSYQTAKDCTLILGIYDESGTTLYATGTAEVAAEETETTLTIDTDEMPPYFFIKGYLADTYTLAPLCTVYDCPNYTQEMQEFFSKTTDDFDPALVLNFDDDTTNNFAVFDEKTIIIPQNTGYNTVVSADSTSGVYVIKNADENILNLKKGDVFSYQYEDEAILIVKVGSISVDGTTVTITEADTSMDEIFDYVRIDAKQNLSDADVTLLNGTEYIEESASNIYASQAGRLSKASENAKESIGGKLEIDLRGKTFSNKPEDLDRGKPYATGKFEISGKAFISVDVDFEYDLSINYVYLELKISYGIGAEFSCTAEAEFRYPFAVLEFTPLTFVTIELRPALVARLEGEISLKSETKGAFGLRLDSRGSDNGFFYETPKYELELKAEGKYFLGIDLQPQASIVDDKISTFSFTSEIGLEFSAENSVSMTDHPETDPEELHECNSCIDGDVNFVFSAKGEAKVPFISKLEYTFAEKKWKIGDFYYSFDKKKGGPTECPYKLHRLDMIVIDKNNDAIQDASIQFYADTAIRTLDAGGLQHNVGTEPLKTDFYGSVTVYVATGEIGVEVSKDGYEPVTRKYKVGTTVWKNLTVNGEETNQVFITLPPPKHNVVFHVTDIYGDPIQGATVTCENKDVEKTDENGTTTIRMSDGKYKVNVSKAFNYYSKNDVPVSVAGEDVVVDVFLEERSIVWFTVLDEQGKALSNANIKINSNTYHTISDGTCFALLSEGTYDVDVSKDDYESQKITMDYSGGVLKKTITLRALSKNPDNHDTIEGKKVVQVALGYYHSAAITEDGSLYTWGNNCHGQLGNGVSGGENFYFDEGIDSNIPIKIMDNVASVSLGSGYSAAITMDGSLYTWGWNQWGQLGDGTTTSSSTPGKIMDNVASVSLGSTYSSAITTDGSLYTWGSNGDGQLGDGTTEDKLTPVKIMDNVTSVSLGGSDSAAITIDGSLYTWGRNYYGQLGDGTTEDKSTPVKIMDNVASVSLGDEYSAAITTDGSLYTWGNNYEGQLGDGTTTNTENPVKIMDNVVSVNLSVGYAYSAAITADSSLYTWGTNRYGQLGSGSTMNFKKPVKIMDNVASVRLGWEHSAAITTDGSLYVWGHNFYGQLGNGKSGGKNFLFDKEIDSNVPIKIEIPTEESETISIMQDEPIKILAEEPQIISLAYNSTNILANEPTNENTFTDLHPNTVYNYYILYTDHADQLLTSANIQYITQFTTDSKGTAAIDTGLTEITEDAVILAIPAEFTSDSGSGDVNCDRVFSLADIVLLQKWLLRDTTVRLKNWQAADLNADNALDVFDLALMKRKLIAESDIIYGDADGDGVFNSEDVLLFQNWLLSDSSVKLKNWQALDLYPDGVLDVFDLVMMKRKLMSQ